MPHLYWFSISFYSQKVLLALAVKNVSVTKRSINLLTYENFTRWFLKINPKGQVPVLEDNGKFIVGSGVIMKYLEDTYGGPQLMPEHSKDKWSHFQKLCEDVNIEVLTYGAGYARPSCIVNCEVPDSILDKMKSDLQEQKRTNHLKSMMEAHPDLREVLEDKFKESEIMDNSIRCEKTLMEELDKTKLLLHEVNETLKNTKEKWLCGPDITVADICLAVLLYRLHMMGYANCLWEDDKLLEVAAYYERLKEWKAFRETCVQFISKMEMFQYVYGEHANFIIAAIVIVLLAIVIGLYLYSG